MPYQFNSELPPAIRSHLPEHAQDIYRETFNFAYAATVGDDEREKCAHMIAWAQVKRSYARNNEQWVQKRHSASS